jgi:hypothetical protein
MIAEFPSNVAAASVAMATGATGALSKFQTTALITTAESMEAMSKAKAGSYSPPS